MRERIAGEADMCGKGEVHLIDISGADVLLDAREFAPVKLACLRESREDARSALQAAEFPPRAKKSEPDER